MFRDFTLTTDDATLVTHFELKEMPPFTPQYHIAPGDRVVTVPASMAKGTTKCRDSRLGLDPG